MILKIISKMPKKTTKATAMSVDTKCGGSNIKDELGKSLSGIRVANSTLPSVTGLSSMKGSGRTVGGKMVGGKKPLSAYNKFVKDNYSKSTHLPVKERLAYIAGLWANSKKS